MNNLPDDCIDNVLTFLRPVRHKDNRPVAPRDVFNSYTYTSLMTKGIRPYLDYREICDATRHLTYAKDKKPIVVEIMVGQYYKSRRTTHSWYFKNEARKINKVPSTKTVIQNPVLYQLVVVEVAGRMYEGEITKICAKTIHIKAIHSQHGFWFRCIARRV